MGAGHQKGHALTRSLELSAHVLTCREGRQLDTELVPDYAHVMNPPQTPRMRGFRAAELANIHVPGGWWSRLHGTEVPALVTLLEITLRASSSGYAFVST